LQSGAYSRYAPFVFYGVKVGRLSRNATRKHSTLLRKLAELETLNPNRRLLAEMLLLTLEGVIPESWFESVFGGRNKNEPEDDKSQEKLSQEAVSGLAKLKEELGGE
jgi:hypothetical protein